MRVLRAVVVGGGVAGLAAANRLAELGHPVTLIEANTYPAHKVCGEFFSPECLPILEEWGVAPKVRVSTARFVLERRTFTFPLPSPAGSASRYTFDAYLAERAEQMGAEVLTGVACEGVERKGDLWEVKAGGREIEAGHLIIGTGRLTGQKRPAFPYRGYKAHFEGKARDLLEMHLHPGAYLGISSVGNGLLNVACIAKAGAPSIEHLLPSSLTGRQLFDWIEVPAPEFGIKAVPDWEGALFVGDAAGTIAPICGDGLAMGITSGVMAAEHIARGDAAGFRRAWLKRYAGRIRLGKWLHKAVLSTPQLALLARPPLLSWIFRKTREFS